jgi:CubicO group peptidase (beta-lactamase class C family)
MKPFFRIFLLALISFLALAWLAFPAAAQPTTDDFAAVDAYITETMRRLPIDGLSLAIVKGDQILYLQGYGTANQSGDPVTPQTPFMLASITKTFTALAIQQLAAAGKLDLDAPLRATIPEFRLADEGAAAALTVRHLLNHTSGISTLEGTQPYAHDPATTFAEALEHLALYRPSHQPGAQVEYSNLNYVLLGEVVTRASGQPYADYVQTNILNPLQMTHTSFADHHTISGAATGHCISFGLSVPCDEKYVPLMLSAGYLTASAEDMAHYLIPYLNQGQYQGHSLLSPQGQGWYDEYWNWYPGIPADNAYGHSGGHNSFNTDFKLFVLHQVGVVMLMNTRLDTIIPAPNASQIAFNIARLVTGFSYEMPSSLQFYGFYAIYDGILLLLGISILWQGTQLKRWKNRFRTASRWERALAGMGIAFDLVAATGIFLLPALNHSSWIVMLSYRSDIASVLLAIGLLLAALGIIKIAFAGIASRTPSISA